MIQLSLFPQHGYGLLGFELAEDSWTGEPALLTDERKAKAAARWLTKRSRIITRVVKLERHEAVDGANGKPTYVIAELKGQQT
jgi:hypothetical protein